METIQLVAVERGREGGDGPVELTLDWNGNEYVYVFPSEAEFLEAASTVTDLAALARALVSFWSSKDATLADSTGVLGQVLTIETEARAAVVAESRSRPTLCWTKSVLS